MDRARPEVLLDLFEVMHSARAMRRLTTDPVPDELVDRLLDAAVCAPNGGNQQKWSFLVVRDPAIKAAVQPYYKAALEFAHAVAYASTPPGTTAAQHEHQFGEVTHLTEHFHEAPVWIVLCLEVGESGARPETGASIYPAAQNIILAARALGLGATLTTRHLRYATEVDAVFGLPPTVRSFAIIPIGWPAAPFGPVRRLPVSAVTHLDRWGQPYRGA
jgi:nitroreductase